jgi:YVTN family beta-propeller protein
MRCRFLQIVLGLAACTASLHGQVSSPQTALINRDAAVYSTGSGKLYFLDSLHDAVQVLSSSESALSVQVGAAPVALALNRDTGRLYVANSRGRSVSILDTHSDKVLATVPTAARPYAIAVDEAANKVYVSNTFSNMLTVIDGTANTVTNLPVGSFDAILVDPDRRRVYLLGYESDTITELNPVTGSTTKLSAGALHLWGLARAGKILYVSHVQDSSIAAIDLETHTIRNLPVGAMPCAIAISRSTGNVYVANYGDGTVTVLRDGEKPRTISVSAHPQALTLDEDAGLLYVSSPQQNAITVLDIKKLQVTWTYQDLDHPYAVGVIPSSHAAYAVNLGNVPFTALKHP